MTTSGSPPTAQSSSAVVYENKVIVFGGIINGRAQNSVHTINLSEFDGIADHIPSMCASDKVGGAILAASYLPHY